MIYFPLPPPDIGLAYEAVQWILHCNEYRVRRLIELGWIEALDNNEVSLDSLLWFIDNDHWRRQSGVWQWMGAGSRLRFEIARYAQAGHRPSRDWLVYRVGRHWRSLLD